MARSIMKLKKRIHLIAIGGSAMHNMAIALSKKGYTITGSDDEIFEPSYSRLNSYNLLPKQIGWDKTRITPDVDAIILGMHAKEDNPELLEAQRLNIPIYSYPEYLYEQTKNKTRVAIAGSHGKTTTTAMIMHVLKYAGIEFDYMVGANLEGFDTMVNLDNKNDIAIFEADEYLSSPIDKRSKFLWYKPQIAVITGIAWDHINVFPTFEEYLTTFSEFIKTLPQEAHVYYYENDKNIQTLLNKNNSIISTPYTELNTIEHNNSIYIENNETKYKLNIFGKHNLQNLMAAHMVLKQLNINDETFFNAISTFRGAARRLQKINSNKGKVYYDFAHAPSKVLATINAIKENYKDKKIIACLELHTFSSLNSKFLPQYYNTMNSADEAIVYFNPNTVKHKALPKISANEIIKNFNHPNISIYNNSEKLFTQLKSVINSDTILLLMTSGNFNGQDITKQFQ